MLSKNQLKYIISLHLKKNRDKERLFFVEGVKMVNELLHSSFKVHSLYGEEDWFRKNEMIVRQKEAKGNLVTEAELSKISMLTTPQLVLALVRMPDDAVELNKLKGKLTLLLDDIKDPGNLGTIIRIADWFGIEQIICSENSVDVYNPKVVQSTMGSIFRVKVFYNELTAFLADNLKSLKLPVYAAMMKGKSIYAADLHNEGFIILGNESEGVGEKLKEYIDESLTIPSFAHGHHAESLNVAVSAAIICSEFRRRIRN